MSYAVRTRLPDTLRRMERHSWRPATVGVLLPCVPQNQNGLNLLSRSPAKLDKRSFSKPHVRLSNAEGQSPCVNLTHGDPLHNTTGQVFHFGLVHREQALACTTPHHTRQ